MRRSVSIGLVGLGSILAGSKMVRILAPRACFVADRTATFERVDMVAE